MLKKIKHLKITGYKTNVFKDKNNKNYFFVNKNVISLVLNLLMIILFIKNFGLK